MIFAMIKCNVTKLCAVIDRQAQPKQGKDGHSFLSFSVRLPVSGRDGKTADLSISVSVDGDNSPASAYYTGRRVQLSGVLTSRKKGDTIYFNLRASHVEFVRNSEADAIEAEIHFQGKTGKDRSGKPAIDRRTDKKGNPFLTFAAYSSEKDGAGREFIWVRFLDFAPEGKDFVKAETCIEVTGALQLGFYNGKTDIGCLVKEIKLWELVSKQAGNGTE